MLYRGEINDSHQQANGLLIAVYVEVSGPERQITLLPSDRPIQFSDAARVRVQLIDLRLYNPYGCVFVGAPIILRVLCTWKSISECCRPAVGLKRTPPSSGSFGVEAEEHLSA